jgi:hypothetical protein
LHVRNGRTNVWRLREDDEEEGEEKGSTCNDDASVNKVVGGDPFEPPSSPSSSSSSSSKNSHYSQHSNHKASFKKPLLKIDVKFYLPMFNGDANTEKLYNWIR